MNDEPKITINGHTCSVGEAATMRVAIESFASELRATALPLGGDLHGRRMTANYLAAIDLIREKIFRP